MGRLIFRADGRPGNGGERARPGRAELRCGVPAAASIGTQPGSAARAILNWCARRVSRRQRPPIAARRKQSRVQEAETSELTSDAGPARCGGNAAKGEPRHTNCAFARSARQRAGTDTKAQGVGGALAKLSDIVCRREGKPAASPGTPQRDVKFARARDKFHARGSVAGEPVKCSTETSAPAGSVSIPQQVERDQAASRKFEGGVALQASIQPRTE